SSDKGFAIVHGWAVGSQTPPGFTPFTSVISPSTSTGTRTVRIITKTEVFNGSAMHHQYLNALYPAPNTNGIPASAGPYGTNPLHNSWSISYVNGGPDPWEGIRVTIEGDNLEQAN